VVRDGPGLGTLVVNVRGGVLMGLLAGWLAARGGTGSAGGCCSAVGLLGGFTTFSAFSLETVQLAGAAQLGRCLGLSAASVALSVGALASVFGSRGGRVREVKTLFVGEGEDGSRLDRWLSGVGLT
jgi:fluoride ion exporter CrcB/FEX